MDSYKAYIGAAQMVNVLKTDKYMYQYVMAAAEKSGNKKLINKLKEAGEPPYYGDGMLNKYRLFLTNYADYYKNENPFQEENTEWYSLASMVLIDEYTFIDKIRYFQGLLKTFPLMYEQLQDIDFVTQVNELEVPVYYMIGKHDYTAKFIEEYFDVLEVPSKELFWFNNSAHGEVWTESDKFHDIMVNKVLAESYKQ